jgi:hypothetical protein
MPKIKEYKTANSYSWLGRYLSLIEFKKLKQILNEYFKDLEDSERKL